MSVFHGNQAAGVLAVVTTGILVGAAGSAVAVEMAHQVDGVRLQFDNDLFAGQTRDRDYTGGISLTLSGDQARQTPEASTAISVRFGQFATPWWSWAPELTDYTAAPVPTARQRRRPESHFFAGIRLKARVYNVFLQGQFRASDVRYGSSELEPFLAEAWLGFATDVLVNTQLVYSVNYQSAEIEHGPASREALWAAVQISRHF